MDSYEQLLLFLLYSQIKIQNTTFTVVFSFSLIDSNVNCLFLLSNFAIYKTCLISYSLIDLF
jgi:hypothetical protein